MMEMLRIEDRYFFFQRIELPKRIEHYKMIVIQV